MFCALLIVAFPITILSINTGELYSNYRTEKKVEEENRLLEQTVEIIKPNKLTDDQLVLLNEMSQDLVVSVENLSKLHEASKNVLEQNASIRSSIQAILGSYVQNKRKSVA